MKRFLPILALLLVTATATAPVWSIPRRSDTTPQILDAARAGDIERVRTLLADPKMVNAIDNGGNTPLHQAIAYSGSYKGMLDLVTLLLDKGADAKAVNDVGQTPLLLAARSSDENAKAVVALLLAKGADAKARDHDGRTALHGVSRVDVATLLLDAGADPNAADIKGNTPLHEATGGSADVISLLLEKGADPNRRNADGDLPIHLILRQSRSVPTALLQKSDLKARDSLGLTAVQAALQGNNDEARKAILALKPETDDATQVAAAAAQNDAVTLKKLIDAKPYLAYARLPGGATPLHIAARFLAQDCVTILLSKKADPNARDAHWRTPLWLVGGRYDAASQLAAREIMALLLKAGADVNAMSDNDSTPLLNAMYRPDKTVISLLLDKGADPNVRNERSMTPLHMLLTGTMRAEDTEMTATLVETLLAKGADLNAPGGFDDYGNGTSGLTPLALAVSRSSSDAGVGEKMVPILLKSGADVAARDDAGNTVLHIAVMRANKAMLATLLAAPKGVKEALATRNLQGRTPLGLALTTKKTEAADALRAAGGTE